MFLTKVVEQVRHGFVFNNFFPERSAAYELQWKNVVEPERPHMTV